MLAGHFPGVPIAALLITITTALINHNHKTYQATMTAMDSAQVEHALVHDEYTRKYFLGVFPVNGLPLDPVPWPSAFVVTAKSVPCFSLNHWLAVYITPYGEGEVFDSLGHPPSHPILQDFLRRNTIRTVYNKLKIQSDNSDVCGHHVLFFLLQRCRGFHPEYIIRNFCRDRKLNDSFVEYFARPLLIPPANILHV